MSPKSPRSDSESSNEEFASATCTISTDASISELESIGLPKQLSFSIKQLEMAVTQRTYDLIVTMK